MAKVADVVVRYVTVGDEVAAKESDLHEPPTSEEYAGMMGRWIRALPLETEVEWTSGNIDPDASPIGLQAFARSLEDDESD
ncbi:MAG: hypothetical protein M3391_09835 [Actinomycetota bacterium]|nr:hypothetical protein [Actinomycetota bacterium]